MAKSVKKILKSTDGETLLESIASLLMFTVLMVAITSMIATSLKMTTHASTQYAALRKRVNLTVETMVSKNPGPAIRFSLPDVALSTTSPDQKVALVVMEFNDENPLPGEGEKPIPQKMMNLFAFVPFPEREATAP